LGIEFDEFYTKEVFSSKELMNGRTFFKAQSFTLSHSTGHLSRIFFSWFSRKFIKSAITFLSV
jgi:hypothetical protein